MNIVVDLVVDGDGDGDGDGSAAQLGQHRNDPGKECDRLSMLIFLEAAEGTDDVEHRSAFHGGAASERVVSSGVGLGASSSGGLGDIQRNSERSMSWLVAKFGVASEDLGCHLNGNSHEFDGAPIYTSIF